MARERARTGPRKWFPRRPRPKLKRRVGAMLAMSVFLIGKAMIGAALGHSSCGSAYKATGRPVVLVVEIYYSSQFLYFGAEFTQVYASRDRARIDRECRGDSNRQKIIKSKFVPGASFACQFRLINTKLTRS
jgi:uncharacterized BrkB/YihY/UPF0761 family membrane protein